jgi:hypothetical protein
MAPVAAVIIAARPPVMEMTTAITKLEKRPTRGSTPARMEKLIASGMRVSATTRPARTSVRATIGDSQAGRVRRGRVGAGRAEAMPPFSGLRAEGRDGPTSPWMPEE